MSTRTNTATWDEKRKHWRISVQKDGVRKNFYSSTPGRTGQREANKKADAWLDGQIVGPRLRVKQAVQQYKEYLAQLRENYQRNITGVQNIMTAVEDGTVRADAPAREYIPQPEKETEQTIMLNALPDPC